MIIINKVVNEILSKKERNIRKLLSLTESPIEEIFLAYLIKFIEESLETELKKTAIDATGMSYLMEFDVDLKRKTAFEDIIGIRLVKAESFEIYEMKPPEGWVDEKDENDYTKRNAKHLIDESDSKNRTIMQTLEIIPQYKVDIDGHNYRLDFAFMLYENFRHQKDLVKKVEIECDGYEYHSDKKVFTKDRERYRRLLSKNWVVFPFSGSEININNNSYYYEEFIKIFKTLEFGRFS